MGYANDGLRSLLEHDGLAQWLLDLCAPLMAAAVWGRFVAPKASHPTTDPQRLLVELLVSGAGVLALAAATSGRRRLYSARP